MKQPNSLTRWLGRPSMGLIGLGILTIGWVVCTILTGLMLKVTWLIFLVGWNLL